MTVFIQANEELTTWRHISEAGGYRPYRGRVGNGDTVIRWGANGGHNLFPAGVRVLNPRLLLDKAEQSARFIANSVSHPIVFSSRDEWLDAGRPVCLLKPRVGQMGTGIRKVRTPTWSHNHIVQEFIDKQREFRAMMVGGSMAFFMEKHPPTNGDFRWNEHRGAQWTNVPEDNNLRRNVKRLGKKALKALEYDFGAMDVIMDAAGNLYCLEVNSRPEFGQRNAERFVRAIAMYLEE